MPFDNDRRADLDYLFVVTYGRSGSTLLQGMLNAIPGYLIRGENRQVLNHLHTFHQAAVEERRRRHRVQRNHNEPVGQAGTTDAFYGMDNFPAAESLTGIRRLVVDTILRPEPDTRVTGFKEVRWASKNTEDFVAWLRAVFPGARFVFNTRDLENVSQSRWWAKHPDSLDRLRRTEARHLALAESLGEAAFRVHYDEWSVDPTALRPMFNWLGEPFDEQPLRDVLAVRHSR